MRQSPEARQRAILALLGERKRVGTAELATTLGVSAPTTRRDVDQLQHEGRVIRRHGFIELPTAPSGTAIPSTRPVVALVAPRSDGYFVDLIAGAREAARQRQLRLVIAISGYSPSEESRIVTQLEQSNTAGIVIVPTPVITSERDNEIFLRTLAQIRIPLVLAERVPPISSIASELPRVSSDHSIGIAAGVRQLVELGYEHLTLVITSSPTSPFLTTGFAATIKDLGLQLRPIIEILASTDLEDTIAEVQQQLAQGIRPAFIVHNDQTAVQLVTSLRVRGIETPRDLAVVAYEDSIASLADPPLSAIAPPRFQVGFAAIGLLADSIEKTTSSETNQHITMIPRLILRGSTPRNS